LGISRVNEHLW